MQEKTSMLFVKLSLMALLYLSSTHAFESSSLNESLSEKIPLCFRGSSLNFALSLMGEESKNGVDDRRIKLVGHKILDKKRMKLFFTEDDLKKQSLLKHCSIF